MIQETSQDTLHTVDRVRQALKQIWGYDNFRPPQEDIVRCLLSGRDALIVMPTGGGKSICFQLPALLNEGLTLVVSPLVALMENQVAELKERDLPAASLHNEISRHDRKRTLKDLQANRLRLLYLSPETLLSPAVWEQLQQPQLPIVGLILDEAHCLVQWGETFRPAYRRLGAVRRALLATKPPGTKLAIAAFTATADPQAQRTIRQTLQLRSPQQFLINPYRSNLHLSVRIAWTPRGRKQQLLRYIQAQKGTSGLVYVRTRADSERLAAWLQETGLTVAAYHAGLGSQERRQQERDWLTGKLQFVVCTSAFGMGINKPDVRWVIHFHVPTLISEYVQEVGRAGRDGKPAEALSLVSEPTGWLDPADQQRRQFFQEKTRSQYRLAQQLARKIPPQGEIRAVAEQFPDAPIALSILHAAGQLEWRDPFHYRTRSQPSASPLLQPDAGKDMEQYLTSRECRWQFLLRAFGFPPQAKSCGHCDNCKKGKQV